MQSKKPNNINYEYSNFLEILKTEIGYFFKLSDKSTWTSKGRIGLKSRKQSILIRSMLKKFRELSIENEKFLKSNKKDKDET